MVKTVWQAVTRPYHTLDQLVTDRNCRPALGLMTVLAVLGGVAVVIPVWNTGQGLLEAGAAFAVIMLTYLGACGAFTLVSRLVAHEGDYLGFLAAWAFSYIPTAIWFAGMLGFHVLGQVVYGSPGLLPRVFVFIFWAFSLTVFLWKVLFYFLTLRIGGNMSFRQMIYSSLLLAPLAVGYWIGMMFLGFKVPFI